MKIPKFFAVICLVIISLASVYTCSSDNSSTVKSTNGMVNRGILRVDAHNRYFVFDDGTPYIPIGLNKFLFLEEDLTIDSLMHLWSEHGINYVRCWVGIGADPEIEVGRFDEKQMFTLDHIIHCGEKYGVYLNICFWNENCLRSQDGEWGWNGSEQIYNKANSDLGTTTDAEDLKDILHEPSWNAMKNRYSYFVDRWKNEPAIIMWDLVNDCKKTEAWKSKMYDFVKDRDGLGHLITFQYNTGVDPQGEMDCGSVRVYNYNPEGNDPEEMMLSLAGRIRQALSHGKPVYCGEGRMNYEEGSEYELERGFLHFLWGPMAVGAAGNLHSWISIRSSKEKWPDPSEKELDWIKIYSDFCKTIDWSHFNSKNVDEEIEVYQPNIKAFACRSNDMLLIYLMNDDPDGVFESTRTQFNISSPLATDRYELKWIDIRSGKEIKSARISDFPVIVETPDFKDGMFGYIRKI